MKENRIMIDINFFEHLLNCLANQKFIGELKEITRKEHQSIIDNAYDMGMKLLNLKKKVKRNE